MVGDQDVGLFANRDAYDMFPDNEKAFCHLSLASHGSKEAANRDRPDHCEYGRRCGIDEADEVCRWMSLKGKKQRKIYAKTPCRRGQAKALRDMGPAGIETVPKQRRATQNRRLPEGSQSRR